MPDFQELFMESRGKPILFKGLTLVMSDDFLINREGVIHVTNESTNSSWRQGIHLSVDGSLEIIRVPPPQTIRDPMIGTAMVMWHDTSPKWMEFRVKSKRGRVDVKNVWDTGDGVMQSWYYGAAMIVEELPNGRRYRCNDGRPDDDFDEIVFRIEHV
jgi:hypothetical protein